MTKDEALAIRQAHANGKPTAALLLHEAVLALQTPPVTKPYKYRLPDLPRPVQERMDAVLCFNLGRALRRTA